MNFDEAFTKLLGHEGGYSNHPADKGGETMWGSTIAVARIGYWCVASTLLLLTLLPWLI